MDGSSEEEEDVAESSQSNEEKVINALMKKLTKEQWINMLINMEQDFSQWDVCQWITFPYQWIQLQQTVLIYLM